MQLINALLTADSPFQLRPRGGGAEGGGQRGGAEGALQGRGGGSFGGSRQERPTIEAKETYYGGSRQKFGTDKGYIKLRCGIFSDGPADLEIHFGPVKKVSRMREKLSKYQWIHESCWPRSYIYIDI